MQGVVGSAVSHCSDIETDRIGATAICYFYLGVSRTLKGKVRTELEHLKLMFELYFLRNDICLIKVLDEFYFDTQVYVTLEVKCVEKHWIVYSAP